MKRRIATLLAVVVLIPSLGAQAQSLPLGAKDPNVATLWSFFIPGAGQMYSEEVGRGFAFLGIATVAGAGALIANAQATSDCVEFVNGQTGNRTEQCHGTRNDGVFYGGIVIYFADWMASTIDAGGSARRYNARHGVARVSVSPILMGGSHRRFGLSVKVR